MPNAQKRGFTGRHMLAVMVIGFGIVIAVNFTMASFAVGGFHGVVVENSYVASQQYNDWLEKAEASKALGWEAQVSRGTDGFVIVDTSDVPAGAQVTAQLRRPIGEREYASLTFSAIGEGKFRSTQSVPTGRWISRLFIETDGQEWSAESELR